MKLHVRFTDRGRRQAEQADAWWRANRAASPSLFVDELERAIELLRETPELGRPFPRPAAPGLRVLVLRETRYLLYYVYRADENELVIAAVWRGLRESGPPIKL